MANRKEHKEFGTFIGAATGLVYNAYKQNKRISDKRQIDFNFEELLLQTIAGGY